MKSIALLLLALAAAPLAHSCPVCFGASAGQEGLITGLTWGLFILLGATFAAVACIGAAVWRIEKSRALAEAAS